MGLGEWSSAVVHQACHNPRTTVFLWFWEWSGGVVRPQKIADSQARWLILEKNFVRIFCCRQGRLSVQGSSLSFFTMQPRACHRPRTTPPLKNRPPETPKGRIWMVRRRWKIIQRGGGGCGLCHGCNYVLFYHSCSFCFGLGFRV